MIVILTIIGTIFFSPLGHCFVVVTWFIPVIFGGMNADFSKLIKYKIDISSSKNLLELQFSESKPISHVANHLYKPRR